MTGKLRTAAMVADTSLGGCLLFDRMIEELHYSVEALELKVQLEVGQEMKRSVAASVLQQLNHQQLSQ